MQRGSGNCSNSRQLVAELDAGLHILSSAFFPERLPKTKQNQTKNTELNPWGEIMLMYHIRCSVEKSVCKSRGRQAASVALSQPGSFRDCFPRAIYFTFGSAYMSMPLSHFVTAEGDQLGAL